jgi:hypothetical protein
MRDGRPAPRSSRSMRWTCANQGIAGIAGTIRLRRSDWLTCVVTGRKIGFGEVSPKRVVQPVDPDSPDVGEGWVVQGDGSAEGEARAEPRPRCPGISCAEADKMGKAVWSCQVGENHSRPGPEGWSSSSRVIAQLAPNHSRIRFRGRAGRRFRAFCSDPEERGVAQPVGVVLPSRTALDVATVWQSRESASNAAPDRRSRSMIY